MCQLFPLMCFHFPNHPRGSLVSLFHSVCVELSVSSHHVTSSFMYVMVLLRLCSCFMYLLFIVFSHIPGLNHVHVYHHSYHSSVTIIIV